ncbi:DUF5131 family protein [Nonomuraea sp. NPDC005650]|uniref:DUF5131 family protein n=1 Tax=Nonomuraea sp. NPDC005650 TaxID=3157045 RepID=UPI0033A8FDE1
MADKTGIEWTDATWNPVRGCTKVSPGCDNCYMERVGKKRAGRDLDGREWNEYPEPATAGAR